MIKENIELLIKDIESSLNIKFNMSLWASLVSRGSRGHPCKTSACIAGFVLNRHYPEVYCDLAEFQSKLYSELEHKELVMYRDLIHNVIHLASGILGISEKQALILFDPASYDNLYYVDATGIRMYIVNEDITKDEALTVLRNLLETGEIDWTKGTRYKK